MKAFVPLAIPFVVLLTWVQRSSAQRSVCPPLASLLSESDADRYVQRICQRSENEETCVSTASCVKMGSRFDCNPIPAYNILCANKPGMNECSAWSNSCEGLKSSSSASPASSSTPGRRPSPSPEEENEDAETVAVVRTTSRPPQPTTTTSIRPSSTHTSSSSSSSSSTSATKTTSTPSGPNNVILDSITPHPIPSGASVSASVSASSPMFVHASSLWNILHVTLLLSLGL